MKSDKVRTFMKLAAQGCAENFETGSEEERLLGARLLLSEVLEYLVQGLGVVPVVDGVAITKPNSVEYVIEGQQPDKKEMLDGLADVAYTMNWNAVKFGMPLETAYDLICDNNLSKFVLLKNWSGNQGQLEPEKWDLNLNITWPDVVVRVEVVKVENQFYAVGKDISGKVQKPSTYRSVDLTQLLESDSNILLRI